MFKWIKYILKLSWFGSRIFRNNVKVIVPTILAFLKELL